MQSALTNLERRFQTAPRAIQRGRRRKQVPLTGKRHLPGEANDSATTQREWAGGSGESRTGRYSTGQTTRHEFFFFELCFIGFGPLPEKYPPKQRTGCNDGDLHPRG